jgi:hypothetical protein
MLTQRINELEKTVLQQEPLSDIVSQHQKYMEHLENNRRAKNLVIYGLPEHYLEVKSPLNGGTNVYKDDQSKVATVLSVLKMSTEVVSTQRLGKPSEDNTHKSRPVLVSLKTTSDRNEILSVAKQLKTGPGNLIKSS